MSPLGHNLTALAVATAWTVSRMPPNEWLSALSETIQWWLFSDEDLSEPVQTVMLALGVILGARAPDKLEIATWWLNHRFSVIPHRTLTHWPVLWLLLALVAFGLSHSQTPFIQGGAWLLGGLVAAGLLHVGIDAMSPTGVPRLFPLRCVPPKRTIYRSSALSEVPVIAACWLVPYGLHISLWG